MAELSQNYFTKRFRSQVGMSPRQYQLNVRMHAAYTMLDQDGLYVSEVADALGYPDTFLFSRQFKQIYGQPPIMIRKKYTVTSDKKFM